MILDTTLSVARPIADIDGLYIVESEPLERLLFDRNLMGSAFRATCLDASVSMLSHLQDELGAAQVSELVLLSKGYVYQLPIAYEAVFGESLPVNLAATRRVSVKDHDATVEVPYLRCESRNDSLLIGDTVASGASVIAALEAYRLIHGLRRVRLLSFAGSLAGARRIRDYCDARSIEITIFYGLAAFGVGANGFDLSFLHEETITADKYRARAQTQFEGKPVSAVGWDFGSQWMAPEKYQELCWMEAEFWGMHGHESLACEKKPSDIRFLAAEAAAFNTRVTRLLPLERTGQARR
jgi:hypothetical protein